MCFLQIIRNGIKSYSYIRSFSDFSTSNLKKTLLTMPRERHVKNNRLNSKEKSVKYAPGTVTLQVLGSGAVGSPAVLYLFTDQSRYLFNCGEGTQRLAHEHKTKLSRLEHIFFTRRNWDKMGGLPGLSLTIQESGVSTLSLHGPAGLDELFTATKRFVVLRDLKIKTVESKVGLYFEDTVMTVHYLPIQKIPNNSNNENVDSENSNDSKKNYKTGHSSRIDSMDLSDENSSSSTRSFSAPDDTDYYAHERSGTRTEPVEMSHLLNLHERAETEVMAYVCRLKPKVGALSLERCVALGVKPGPLFGELKNGNDITLPNGNVVRSSDVRMPDDPGPLFIVLDIPTVDYLDSLEQNTEMEKYQMNAKSDEDLAALVVHFTPPEIMNHPRYQNFMDKFSPSTMHLKVNEDNKYSVSPSVQRLQHQLHQLDDLVFPLLKEKLPEYNLDSNTPGTVRKYNSPSSGPEMKKFKSDPEINMDTSSKEANSQEVSNGTNMKLVMCENSNTMSCFHLRPKKGFDRSSEPLITPSAYIAETDAIDGFHSSLQELKSNMPKTKTEYPRIIFLGTGSCIPNKTRNTSAILIRLSDSNNILLDCGEGTFGQLVRHFGVESLPGVMQNLKSIYISHLHADHHIGLIGLLQGRRKILGDSFTPVTLFAPKQISSWLEFYNKRFERIKNDYNLISNQSLVEGSDDVFCLHQLGIKYIQTCIVRHCPHAFGIALETLDNKKITYSGDTMPCQELVDLGKDSDILIHEATMEDDLAGEAKYKMHSTISQAISIGNSMNAKNILLTHFSQRYAKIPRIQNISTIGNVGLAFDHMEIGIEDFSKLPLMYTCLKVMFSEHCEELEERAAKRAFKKQLVGSRAASPVNNIST